MLNLLLPCLATAALYLVVRRSRKRRTNPIQLLPGPPPESFVTGNLQQIFDPSSFPYHSYLTERYGKVIKLNGLLGEPMIFLSDTKALWDVTIKEADKYELDESFMFLSKLAFGPGVLSSIGATHKRQRKLLDPAFSSTNIRQLYSTFDELSARLVDEMHKKGIFHDSGPAIVDIVDWVGRLNLEAIGVAGFGHSFAAFEPDGGEYAKALKSFFPNLANIQHWMPLLPFLCRNISASVRRRLAEFIPMLSLHNLLGIVDVMHRQGTVVLSEVKRSISLSQDGISTHDGRDKSILSIFVKANANAELEDRITDDEIVAQISTIVFAATDTSTSAISHIIQLLSENLDAQERLRAEILDADKLDYEVVTGLPYLDAIVKETLRLYPPVPIIMRRANQDGILPLSDPVVGDDGTKIDSIHVAKGTSVFMNITGVNRDSGTWGEDALLWRPERWLQELPKSVGDAHVPTTYAHQFTFLAGRRSCLGSKFAIVMIKTAVMHLIRAFKFEPAGERITWKMGAISAPSVGGSVAPKLTISATPVADVVSK